MEILLLGGTAALGRAIAREALTRGHSVTCVARGNGPATPGAALTRADRDSEGGLAPAKEKHWGAAIDLTRHPAHARRAVRDVNAHHWVSVSTVSVYSRLNVPGRDESAVLEEPMQGDYLTELSDYGGAKVACEDVYRATSSHTIIRPGPIGGGEDRSGRSGYYPWRFAHPTADDVLAELGVNPWMGPRSLPLWVGNPSLRHVGSIDSSSAKQHGLRLRPLRDTLVAALEYENASVVPCASGLSDAEEIEVRRRLAESVP